MRDDDTQERERDVFDRRTSPRDDDIPDRRQTDKRLNRVEENIAIIKEKIEGNILERTARHTSQLDTLVTKNNRLDTSLHDFKNTAHHRNETINLKVDAINESIVQLKKESNKWNTAIVKILWTGIMVVAGMFGWAVYSSAEIARFVEHLFEVTGTDDEL